MKYLLISFLFVLLSLNAEEWEAMNLEKFRKDYWAYQPLKVNIPDTDSDWVKTDIDRYILRKQLGLSLTPSPEAEKSILIKRAYYALTGLPPTYEEVERFINDNSPDSYEKLIDKLLASKSYGEKWGRHWLDLVRFADTQGFLAGGRDTTYPFSYTFRDYVIRSFNEDKPYNEFIMQHLAADKMDLKDKRDLAGLGFLTTGERFLNKKHEIVNDQIDVTTQAFLGLTVSCARCHDHKFDPIPTADYYSMFGIFSSIEEPALDELPVIGESSNPRLYAEYKSELEKREKAIADAEQGFRDKIEKEWKLVAHDYVTHIIETIGGNKNLPKIDSMGNQFRKRLIRDFMVYMTRSKAAKGPVFRLLVSSARDRKTFGRQLEKELSAKDLNPNIKNVLTSKQIKTYEQFLKEFAILVQEAAKEPEKYPQIHEYVYGKSFKKILNAGNVTRFISNAEDKAYNKLKNKLKEHFRSPGAPARAMVVRDKASPTNQYVFLRGNPSGRGPNVPRRFLQILSTEKAHEKFTDGSGRLELAEAIADKKNPLTARVIVNRVWQWHFGTGIVNTPSNFGLLGARPTHPELLDYLADWFMENGWSFKKLHKHIMMSAVYRQKSVNRPDMAEIDGANTFLWKMNNRRVQWEELRDSIIAKTGQLKDYSGPPVIMMKDKYQPYRTVYGFIDRNNVPAAYKSFDFPSALVTCEMRATTIVPQQGLFLLNSNFIMKSSQMITSGLKAKGKEERIAELFKNIYSRKPAPEEVKFCLDYLAEAERTFKEKAVPEWIFGYATLTDDKMLKDFVRFKFFNKSRWQVSQHFPDKQVGYAMLSDKGGHPGKTKAVVRRCRIHKDGQLSIKGAVKHKNDKGNGVRVVILHNGTLMGEWDCKTQTISTNCENIDVKAGDIIDMVVDAKSNPTSDSFEWPLEMQLKSNSKVEEFSTVDSFFDKKTVRDYSSWEGLAQVLMMSNEFLYVD